MTNPLAAPGSINFVQRTVIPRVSHEGLAFDKDKAMYFVDENSGGGIFKYVSKTPNNGATYFDAGQTFVLKVGAGGNAEATGGGTWVPITDANGNALQAIPTVTVNGVTSVDGRAARAAVGATSFNRPEDMEIQTLPNGKQVLYFTATTNSKVFSINLNDGVTPSINLAVSKATINKATNAAAGTQFQDPDNLAIDADGNIYIVEDQPAGVADIWFLYDADRDGIAESIGRWASLSTPGSEPTGLYFDPFRPNIAYVNVQHADSDIDRTIEITAVPEPGTMAAMLGGVVALGGVFRRKRGA